MNNNNDIDFENLYSNLKQENKKISYLLQSKKYNIVYSKLKNNLNTRIKLLKSGSKIEYEESKIYFKLLSQISKKTSSSKIFDFKEGMNCFV